MDDGHFCCINKIGKEKKEKTVELVGN